MANSGKDSAMLRKFQHWNPAIARKILVPLSPWVIYTFYKSVCLLVAFILVSITYC